MPTFLPYNYLQLNQTHITSNLQKLKKKWLKIAYQIIAESYGFFFFLVFLLIWDDNGKKMDEEDETFTILSFYTWLNN